MLTRALTIQFFVIYDATWISITKKTALITRNLYIDDVSNKKVSGFRGSTRIVLKYFPC